MNVLTLLSITAAAAADQTCDLHLRWSDGSEERVNQNQGLALYTASAKHRAAPAGTPAPKTNSDPWAAWFVNYANDYDKAHGGPPSGYVAPAKVAPVEPAGQTSLFPTGGAGVEVVTDPRILRQRALEAMDPGEYKAAAKAAGVQGYARMKKADIIAAILVAEFDKPAAPKVDEPAPAPEPTPEPAPKAKKTRVGKAAAPPADETPAPAPAVVETAPETPADDGWTDTDIRVHARTALAGTAAQAIERLNALAPEDDGLPVVDVLRAALAMEQAEKRPRKSVIAAIEARIAALTASPAETGGGIVAQPDAPQGTGIQGTVIQDGETRPEVATEGLGGSGVEMGGGMGLGGGVELGGGLGTGEGELSGGLTGESVGGIGGAGRDDTPTGIKHRPGAGCKQPDKVDGWEAGRILVVVKPHRGEFKDWGTCEYRVRCEEDGTYTLVKFTGARKPTDVGNIFEGKHWDYVSQMLTDLMGIPRDANGKPAHHHRMTLRRWFALGRAA